MVTTRLTASGCLALTNGHIAGGTTKKQNDWFGVLDTETRDV